MTVHHIVMICRPKIGCAYWLNDCHVIRSILHQASDTDEVFKSLLQQMEAPQQQTKAQEQRMEAQQQQLQAQEEKMEAQQQQLKAQEQEMEAQQQQVEALRMQLIQTLDQKTQQPPEASPEANLDRPEGMFVPLDGLRNVTEFPRRGNDSSRCPSYVRSFFTAATTLFVVVSHRWLEPTEPHPDHPGQGSPKLKLVIEACNQLLHAMPSGFTIALWMDWMSLNQDGNPVEELGDSMQRLIGEKKA